MGSQLQNLDDLGNQAEHRAMKKTSLIARGFFLSLTSLALVACSAKHSGPRAGAEAQMMARSGSKVTGDLRLEDHHGGILVSGNLKGLRTDREYRLEIHPVADCSASDATSTGQAEHVFIPVKNQDKSVSVITSKGEVAAYAKGYGLRGRQSVVGKSLVIVSENKSSQTEARAACGVIERTYACASCSEKPAMCSSCSKSGKSCCGGACQKAAKKTGECQCKSKKKS
jgi:hypothetical protein